MLKFKEYVESFRQSNIFLTDANADSILSTRQKLVFKIYCIELFLNEINLNSLEGELLSEAKQCINIAKLWISKARECLLSGKFKGLTKIENKAKKYANTVDRRPNLPDNIRTNFLASMQLAEVVSYSSVKLVLNGTASIAWDLTLVFGEKTNRWNQTKDHLIMVLNKFAAEKQEIDNPLVKTMLKSVIDAIYYGKDIENTIALQLDTLEEYQPSQYQEFVKYLRSMGIEGDNTALANGIYDKKEYFRYLVHEI